MQKIVVIALVLGYACTAQAQTVPEAGPAAGAVDYVNMHYQGVYRSGPKTHYAKSSDGSSVATETFSDLASLKTTLVADEQMWLKYPNIGDRKDFPNARVPEELRDVSVIAYVHAVALENGTPIRMQDSARSGWGLPDGYVHADMDFHVMLGTSPRHGEGSFFGAEVSALPADGMDVEDFKRARRQLLDILLNVAKKPEASFSARFAEINPPIKVKVRGSLLFDADHAIGTFEPDYAKSTTAWEIHPVISIEPQ